MSPELELSRFHGRWRTNGEGTDDEHVDAQQTDEQRRGGGHRVGCGPPRERRVAGAADPRRPRGQRGPCVPGAGPRARVAGGALRTARRRGLFGRHGAPSRASCWSRSTLRRVFPPSTCEEPSRGTSTGARCRRARTHRRRPSSRRLRWLRMEARRSLPAPTRAYDRLTPEEKDRYGKLRVRHTIGATQRLVTPEPTPEQEASWVRGLVREHPLVWRHRSGRNSLVLGATTESVVGMGPLRGERSWTISSSDRRRPSRCIATNGTSGTR